MSDLKHSLALVDTLVLQELIRITQAALTDEETVTRVAKDTGINEDRITILKSLSAELLEAKGTRPSISTVDDLNTASNDLARGQASF